MNLVRSCVVLASGFLSLLILQPTDATAAVSVTLSWNAPGDDGMLGTASKYDLRYSTSLITTANFASATKWLATPTPKTPGTAQSTTVTGLTNNITYWFAMKAGDEIPNWSVLSNVVMVTAHTTGVGDQPLVLEFAAPWPNPASQSTRCAFTLPEGAMVQVDVFDVAGRHMRSLASGWHEAGHEDLDWNLQDDSGRLVGAGVYLVRARVGSTAWTKRIVVAN